MAGGCYGDCYAGCDARVTLAGYARRFTVGRVGVVRWPRLAAGDFSSRERSRCRGIVLPAGGREDLLGGSSSRPVGSCPRPAAGDFSSGDRPPLPRDRTPGQRPGTSPRGIVPRCRGIVPPASGRGLLLGGSSPVAAGSCPRPAAGDFSSGDRPPLPRDRAPGRRPGTSLRGIVPRCRGICTPGRRPGTSPRGIVPRCRGIVSPASGRGLLLGGSSPVAAGSYPRPAAGDFSSGDRPPLPRDRAPGQRPGTSPGGIVPRCRGIVPPASGRQLLPAGS